MNANGHDLDGHEQPALPGMSAPTPVLAPAPVKDRPELARGARLITQAMAARGWDCEDVARRLSPRVTSSAVHGWAHGKSTPVLLFREPLARLLGLEPDMLLPEGETEAQHAKRLSADKGAVTRYNQPHALRARRKIVTMRAPVPVLAQPVPQPAVATAAAVVTVTPPQVGVEPFVEVRSFNRDIGGISVLEVRLRGLDADLRPLADMVEQYIACRANA
jgi:hypothetical protein